MDRPLTDQQLDDYEARATAATRCPKAVANGRQDGEHTWRGSMTHLRCELCNYTRPRGERAEETAALVAEVRRLRTELATAYQDAADVADEAVSPDLPRSDYDQGRIDAGRDIRNWANHIAVSSAVPRP